MSERTYAKFHRITYSLTPLEVERAIIDSLSEEYGSVFNEQTNVRIDEDGFATISTEFPCTDDTP